MQDAIEKKIEKFSSQNANVQKRVNTSSKFRNNSHMMLGSGVNKSQISAKHGPGTSGGNGVGTGGLGPISKKKFSINGGNHSDINNFGNMNDSETMSFQNINVTNPNESFNNGSSINALNPVNLKYNLMGSKNQTLNPQKANHANRNSKLQNQLVNAQNSIE